jgi:hypothetical protein
VLMMAGLGLAGCSKPQPPTGGGASGGPLRGSLVATKPSYKRRVMDLAGSSDARLTAVAELVADGSVSPSCRPRSAYPSRPCL